MLTLLPIEIDNAWFWTGDTVYLFITSSNNWTDEDGEYHLEGIPEDKRSPHIPFVGAVQGADLLFENVSVPPTTTSPDRPRTRLTGAVYDSSLRFKFMLFERWVFPDDLNPLNFEALATFNAGCTTDLDPKRFLDREQTLAEIQFAIAGIVLENMPTAQGTAEMVDGVIIVAEALTGAFSRIYVVSQDAGVTGSLSAPRGADRVVGASFTIRSSNIGDNGTVAWSMVEP